MEPAALLQKLREAGCEIVPDGDRLRVRYPAGALTDDLREAIRQYKAELLHLLSVGSMGQGKAQSSPAPGVTLALSLQPDGTCWCCKGDNWWLSRYGVLACAACHPPAHPGLVVRHLKGKEAIELARA